MDTWLLFLTRPTRPTANEVRQTISAFARLWHFWFLLTRHRFLIAQFNFHIPTFFIYLLYVCLGLKLLFTFMQNKCGLHFLFLFASS